MRLGDWVLTQDEADDMVVITMSRAVCRAVVDELDSASEELTTAMDEAQAKARDSDMPIYILIRVR